MIVAAVLGALALTSWGVASIGHVDDRRRVDHVGGTWMALARSADHGVLYPPLYDGVRFGGTRFAPVPIVLQAAAAKVTGEYLVSAKIVGALAFAALLAVLFVLLQGMCPTPIALLLTGTLAVTGTGLVAGLSVRNDALPVVLQLAARPRRRIDEPAPVRTSITCSTCRCSPCS